MEKVALRIILTSHLRMNQDRLFGGGQWVAGLGGTAGAGFKNCEGLYLTEVPCQERKLTLGVRNTAVLGVFFYVLKGDLLNN